MSPGYDGQLLVNRKFSTFDIDFTDNIGGGLELNGDITLTFSDTLVLIHDVEATSWLKLSYSNNQ